MPAMNLCGTAVWSQVVLLHDLLVVDGVSDVNVALVRHMRYSRIQIDGVAGNLLLREVGIDTLQQRRLSGSRHSNKQQARWQLSLLLV